MNNKLKYLSEWTKGKDDLVHTKEFSKIVNFYLFSTPCIRTSSSGVSLRKRGWSDKPWKSGKLRTYLLKEAGLTEGINFVKVKSLDDVSKTAASIGLTKAFYKQVENNRIAFYLTGKGAEFMDIFFYIRCAFAHGRFKISQSKNGERYYYIEAVEKIKGSDYCTLKARMVLNEKTLIDWIDTITNGELAFNKKQESLDNELRERIINHINQSEVGASKRSILESIDIEERLIVNQIEILKKNRMIVFDKHRRTWIRFGGMEEQ